MIYTDKGEIVIAPKVKPEDINKFDINKKSPINRKNVEQKLYKRKWLFLEKI